MYYYSNIYIYIYIETKYKFCYNQYIFETLIVCDDLNIMFENVYFVILTQCVTCVIRRFIIQSYNNAVLIQQRCIFYCTLITGFSM
jgi:hypothetical protein